jgi:hypothetical protein
LARIGRIREEPRSFAFAATRDKSRALGYFEAPGDAACTTESQAEEDAHMLPRWIRDKLTWIVVFAAIAAASSAYSAYKLYQMTDGRPVPTKSKR